VPAHSIRFKAGKVIHAWQLSLHPHHPPTLCPRHSCSTLLLLCISFVCFLLLQLTMGLNYRKEFLFHVHNRKETTVRALKLGWWANILRSGILTKNWSLLFFSCSSVLSMLSVNNNYMPLQACTKPGGPGDGSSFKRMAASWPGSCESSGSLTELELWTATELVPRLAVAVTVLIDKRHTCIIPVKIPTIILPHAALLLHWNNVLIWVSSRLLDT